MGPHLSAFCFLLFAFIVNLIVTTLWLSIIAWLIGRILTDRYPWSQWLWWTPTPAALIAALFGLTFAFRRARFAHRRRRRIIAWSVCVIGLLMYGTLVEHRLLSAAQTPPADALTLAHWNMTLDNSADIDALVRGVESLDCDITALTIAPPEVRRVLTEFAAASEGRLQILGGWPMFVVTRMPIMRQSLLVGTEGMFILLVELDATPRLGRPITLCLVDLPSNPRLPRMQMARRVRAMLDDADMQPPDIVVGDFNITRGSASIATLFPGLCHAYDSAGHGYGASFPRRLPLYHIDHVLLGAGLTAARYDILDQGLSRHRAQKVWVRASR